MLDWYDRSINQKLSPPLKVEAGMKENIMIALMAMCIAGDALSIANFVAKETGTAVEQIVDIPPETEVQIRQFIANKEQDPEQQALVERAQSLAEEAKSEVIVARTGPDVTDRLVDAVIAIEGADPQYIGPAGDTGLMQILPSTWEEVNEKYFSGQYPYEEYARNAHVNKAFGKKYLEHIGKWLSTKDLKGDLTFLMLAAYNGGIGTIQRCNFDPEVLRNENPAAYDYARRALNVAES